MGLGYEYIMFAGKHDNAVTRAFSAPGLWVQRITTKEPTLDMLEIAITSIKCALRDDFPEFAEFYATRGWEPKQEDTAETDSTADNTADAIDPAVDNTAEDTEAQPETAEDTEAQPETAEDTPVDTPEHATP